MAGPKDANRPPVTTVMGQKLLAGWTMLADECPMCPGVRRQGSET